MENVTSINARHVHNNFRNGFRPFAFMTQMHYRLANSTGLKKRDCVTLTIAGKEDIIRKINGGRKGEILCWRTYIIIK
jgi:hypothetical protein